MISKLFTGITGCLIFANLNSYGIGLVPFCSTPAVHAVYRGIWAVFDNPAGIAEQEAFSAGVSYHSRFLLRELSDQAFAVSLPVKRVGCFGLGYHQFGYTLYKEQHAGLVYARSFGSAVSAGVRFDYVSTHFGNEYGNSDLITGSAGIIARITESLRVGVSIFNPQQSTMSDIEDVQYPAVMQAGISWNFKGETAIALGVTKSSQQEKIIQCGFRYQVSKRFLLHAAVSGGSDSFLFGYAFRISRIEIGMASGYHQQLGFSPRFLLTFKSK